MIVPPPQPTAALTPASACSCSSTVTARTYTFKLREHDRNFTDFVANLESFVQMQHVHIFKFIDYALGQMIFVETSGDKDGIRLYCHVYST